MKPNIYQIITILRVLFTIVCGAFLVYTIIHFSVFISTMFSLFGVIAAATFFNYTEL